MGVFVLFEAEVPSVPSHAAQISFCSDVVATLKDKLDAFGIDTSKMTISCLPIVITAAEKAAGWTFPSVRGGERATNNQGYALAVSISGRRLSTGGGYVMQAGIDIATSGTAFLSATAATEAAVLAAAAAISPTDAAFSSAWASIGANTTTIGVATPAAITAVEVYNAYPPPPSPPPCATSCTRMMNGASSDGPICIQQGMKNSAGCSSGLIGSCTQIPDPLDVACYPVRSGDGNLCDAGMTLCSVSGASGACGSKSDKKKKKCSKFAQRNKTPKKCPKKKWKKKCKKTCCEAGF